MRRLPTGILIYGASGALLMIIGLSIASLGYSAVRKAPRPSHSARTPWPKAPSGSTIANAQPAEPTAAAPHEPHGHAPAPHAARGSTLERAATTAAPAPSSVPRPTAQGPAAPLPPGLAARALKESARLHFLKQRYAEAVRDYRGATELAPRDAGAYAGLGGSLLAAGDAKGAVAAYRKAVELQPRTSGFHAALGRAHFASGDRPRAVAAYRHAIELDPNNRAAVSGLAQLGR